jgi:hypothetical protein
MSFDGPAVRHADDVVLGEGDTAAEADALRKVERTDRALGVVALVCLVVISLQGCLLLPLTILLYGWK